jgi:hypothetical protein
MHSALMCIDAAGFFWLVFCDYHRRDGKRHKQADGAGSKARHRSSAPGDRVARFYKPRGEGKLLVATVRTAEL